jgi:hypothetical protein
MSEPVKQFFRVFNDYNVDDAIMDTPWISNTLNKLETYGEDLGEQMEEKIKNIGKKHANPLSTLPPNHQELSFIKPDQPTTLYNVSNTKTKKPLLQKVSQTFSGLSYRIRGWNAEATSDLGKGREFSAIAGEEVGLRYEQYNKGVGNSLSFTHNIRNGVTEVYYHNETITESKCISLFTQDGNIGGTLSYYNKLAKLSAGLSVDKNSTSVSANWNPKPNMEFGIYGNRDFHNKVNNVIGVHGRVTM